jgi:hypothetical protein
LCRWEAREVVFPIKAIRYHGMAFEFVHSGIECGIHGQHWI